MPAPKKYTAALEAEWNRRLASEGLGPVRLLTQSSVSSRNGLVCVSLDTCKGLSTWTSPDWADAQNIDAHGAALSVAGTGTAQFWRAYSAAIWRLPSSWPKRDVELLHSYAQHGNLLRAARERGVKRATARGAVERFERWRKANPC